MRGGSTVDRALPSFLRVEGTRLDQGQSVAAGGAIIETEL